MATLLEQLQQRLAGQQATPTVAAGPNIAEILQAKKGKAATSPTGIANTSVATGMAEDQAQVAAQQQQQVGVLQSQDLAGKADQVAKEAALKQQQLASTENIGAQKLAGDAARNRAETAGLEQMNTQKIEAEKSQKLQDLNNRSILAAQKMASDRGISLDNLFSDARQENSLLASRKDAAQLEQKAAVLAWSDQAYMNNIRRIGEERNLSDSIAFDKAATELAFGIDYAKKLQEIGFAVGQDVKDREIREQIAQLSNYEILDIANSASKAENLKAQYEAGGTILKEGASYVAPKIKEYLAPSEPAPKEGV